MPHVNPSTKKLRKELGTSWQLGRSTSTGLDYSDVSSRALGPSIAFVQNRDNNNSIFSKKLEVFVIRAVYTF